MGCLQFVCFIDYLKYLYFMFTDVLGEEEDGEEEEEDGKEEEDTDIDCLQ